MRVSVSISRNQVIKNARKFSKDWKDEVSEKAESQTFWNEFFAVFGINRRQVGIFEAKLTKLNGHRGFIDVFWPGKLVCEQKSRGQDLEKAFHQALEYLEATAKVDPDQLPRYVIVCDFEFLRLYDLETQAQTQIVVADLADHIHLFSFLHDQITEIKQAEEAANIEAAEKMGKLHDQLKAIGYDGHALEVMLIRLLFCLFAEDTGIFAKYQFTNFIQRKTKADGSDLAPQISMLFHVLNQPEPQRLKNLDQDLADFAYINGQLFAEPLPPASFDSEMRNLLLEACEMDWSKISPEIFGALFQSVMDVEQRRSLGAHYTSEENILKVISSLFMDELRGEFEDLRKKGKGKARTAALDTFHEKLANLDFLDPACGCGNFLIVAYRELRLLELDVIEEIYAKGQLLDVSTIVRCNVSQFHGIEIEDFPSQIARVAMWLVDHQMNMLVSEHYGTHFARIPLKTVANIQNANALEVLWPTVDYVFGNPPFIGHSNRSVDQIVSFNAVVPTGGRFGKVDFVGAWFVKATELIIKNKFLKVAFVSTNSITQGEQASVLWEWIFNQGVEIDFAHRTFTWQNSARGKASVHCVIVGFSFKNDKPKFIFDYENSKGNIPIKYDVKRINQYLADAPLFIIPSRSKNPKNLPKMIQGSKPVDGGYLILSEEESTSIVTKYPSLKKYVKPFMGSREAINRGIRYCLWFADITTLELAEVSKIAEIKERLNCIKSLRLASPTAEFREYAQYPYLFVQNRQPDQDYLLFPRVSSERRKYLPISYFSKDIILSDTAYGLVGSNYYHLGILLSTMHNVWMRLLCGRLKSDYRYTPNIYQTFPWLKDPSKNILENISDAAKKILEVREEELSRDKRITLATLYDPDLMPKKLQHAHNALDKIVDASYRNKKFTNEAERIAFLFELYEQNVELEKKEQDKNKN